jgi:hypothetical protein
VSFFVVLVVFILPFVAEGHMLYPSSLLAVFMGGIYLLFYPLLKEEEVAFAFPIVFSLFYFNILYIMGVSLSMMGILYTPLGLISVVLAILRYRSGVSWFSPFFFATFFMSAVSLFISLYAFTPYTLLNIYNLIIWTAIYLVAAQLIRKKPTEEEASAHA